MIVVAGLSVGGMGSHEPNTPAGYAIAGLLILGGLSLFLSSRFSFYLALFAALVTALSGVLAHAGHPTWAMPVPWWLSVVVGLYLCIRVPLAYFQQPKRSKPLGNVDEEEKSPPAGDV